MFEFKIWCLTSGNIPDLWSWIDYFKSKIPLIFVSNTYSKLSCRKVASSRPVYYLFNFELIWPKVTVHTLYNAILRTPRNFLETRENVKILTHPFYHINLSWFSWEWSKKGNNFLRYGCPPLALFGFPKGRIKSEAIFPIGIAHWSTSRSRFLLKFIFWPPGGTFLVVTWASVGQI